MRDIKFTRENKEALNITLDKSVLVVIDGFVKKFKSNRSHIINELLKSTIEELKIQGSQEDNNNEKKEEVKEE